LSIRRSARSSSSRCATCARCAGATARFFWELFHDSAQPDRFLESFMDESWTEHLRQHERVSVADREIQRRANRFLVEGESTRSTHWLADR
jgi:hypothetical protein